MLEIIKLAAPCIIAIVITAIITPAWIIVCKKYHLFDKPDDRKHHIASTPSMGGLSIVAGIFISFFIFSAGDDFLKLKFIFGASMLLFFTGIFDDLLNMRPQKKIVMQVIAGILVIAGGTRLTNLYGLMGIYDIPLWFQYPITLLLIILFTNAFNFIDGIDGLAGSIGLISTVIFGYLFFKYGQIDFALLCFCLTGSLVGFLFYNFHPAKVFMGDTGSLVIGFLLICFAVNLLNLNNVSPHDVLAISPSFVFAVLFIPVYDIARVSLIRILNRESIFKADRNHIHHMILRHGFGHGLASLMLAAFNIFIIVLEYILSSLNVNGFILLSICVSMLMINSIVMIRIAGIRKKLFGEEGKKYGVE
ncbi:MAG TPA: MraY family glycosyltransferase [Bacteroidia bacterium]|nr:MraY family glycosyltransferase [Bacteroidia bacterium]